jgi:YidC/Oxa1 family membrane protein insertase
MDTLRFILVLSLAMTGMLLWQAWQADYGAPPPAVAPVPERSAVAEVPVVPEEIAPAIAMPEPAAAEVVTAVTDVFRIEFDMQGAGIRHAELLQYPVSLGEPDTPFVLLDGAGPDQYVAQGGLLSRQAAPTHEASFRSPRREYVLDPARDSLIVPFHWREGDVEVTKRFEFTRGSYLIAVSYEIHNSGQQPWSGRSYLQIQRSDPGRAGRRLIYTYVGAVLSSPENRYQKIDFDQIREQPTEMEITDGWAAMLQHYFVTALLPADRTVTFRYYTRQLPRERFAVGAISPPVEAAPEQFAELREQLYIGPKVQDTLEQIAPGLELTVDYGALWVIAKPLYWCLERLHSLVGNWGWAIVLVTVLLKLAFFHLSAAGYRSMANMRRVQPRIMALRDRYKDDRARLNQAMMQIYKEEKINPFGGCLPILIQIPVFIALYWVLLESVELRQAPWVLWIRDLSTPDPYFVLPLVMGVTMFVQQKLNPAAMDPIQERVLQIMPFAFTIFFAFFPSGLVLYWVVNNVLSIAQQWLITKHIVQPNPPAAQ